MHSVACARCSTSMRRHAPVGVLLHSCTCARIDALRARMHTGRAEAYLAPCTPVRQYLARLD